MSSNTISITPKELARFNRSMDKYSKKAQKDVKTEVQKATINIERYAKTNVKKNDLLGTRVSVANLIRRRVFNRGFSGEVISGHKAAVYIEEGTKPHVILPKKGKYLVFKVGTAGSLKTGKMTESKKIFARKVNHPGTRANPYMKPAADKEMPRFVSRIIKIL